MCGGVAISPVGVRFVCEACAEESLVALPVTRARYGTVDCPICGSTYLLLLDARRADKPDDRRG